MFTEVNGIIIQDLSILLKLHLKYKAVLHTLDYKMGFLRIQMFSIQKEPFCIVWEGSHLFKLRNLFTTFSFYSISSLLCKNHVFKVSSFKSHKREVPSAEYKECMAIIFLQYHRLESCISRQRLFQMLTCVSSLFLSLLSSFSFPNFIISRLLLPVNS